jgi:hypothetical protein
MKVGFCGLLLFLLMLGVAVLSGCGKPSEIEEPPLSEFTADIYQPAPTPGSDLDLIEADAGITIPPSAREIYAMVSGFRELDTWVRFDLPARDLTFFLENTHCTTPLVATSPEQYTPGDLDPDWWQPHEALNLLECSGGHSFLRQQILVDRTDSQVSRVYVFSMVDNFATSTPGSE